MPRRAHTDWPDPRAEAAAGREPAYFGFSGNWPELQRFGWELLERQPGRLWYLTYPDPSGLEVDSPDGLLILEAAAAAENLARLLGNRAGLHTKRMGVPPDETIAAAFTLRTIDGSSVAPIPEPLTRDSWRPAPAPFGHATAKNLGWYALVDTPDAAYARHLVERTRAELDVTVYALARTCVTYLHAWPDLARAFAKRGLAIRRAHGLPHGHEPLSAISFLEGERRVHVFFQAPDIESGSIKLERGKPGVASWRSGRYDPVAIGPVITGYQRQPAGERGDEAGRGHHEAARPAGDDHPQPGGGDADRGHGGGDADQGPSDPARGQGSISPAEFAERLAVARRKLLAFGPVPDTGLGITTPFERDRFVTVKACDEWIADPEKFCAAVVAEGGLERIERGVDTLFGPKPKGFLGQARADHVRADPVLRARQQPGSRAGGPDAAEPCGDAPQGRDDGAQGPCTREPRERAGDE